MKKISWKKRVEFIQTTFSDIYLEKYLIKEIGWSGYDITAKEFLMTYRFNTQEDILKLYDLAKQKVFNKEMKNILK